MRKRVRFTHHPPRDLGLVRYAAHRRFWLSLGTILIIPTRLKRVYSAQEDANWRRAVTCLANTFRALCFFLLLFTYLGN